MEGRLHWLKELGPTVGAGVAARFVFRPGAPLCRAVMEPWRWLHSGLDHVTSHVPLKGVG